MLSESLTLALGFSVLLISTFAFVVLYYRRLKAVNKEYLEARRTVEMIVTTFKGRYDQLSSALQQLKGQISTTQSTSKEIIEMTDHLSRQLDEALRTLEQSKKLGDGLSDSVSILQEEVRQLKNGQEALQSKISSSASEAQPKRLRSTAQKEDSTPSVDSRLTETENIALQFLLSQGPKTAREVEVKIGKTREHTARLMKKLWQEGYVERETHKIPFTYRAAGALRDLENAST
jgi:uncharacterized phage infection (PIP) family protein YhgE